MLDFSFGFPMLIVISLIIWSWVVFFSAVFGNLEDDTFKAELKEAIEDHEKEMQDYDDWIDQKAEEAKHDVD